MIILKVRNNTIKGKHVLSLLDKSGISMSNMVDKGVTRYSK